MPMHDWTRVTAGVYHAFHTARIAAIQMALNDGLLSPAYYAPAEQVAGDIGPDVLTLRSAAVDGGDRFAGPPGDANGYGSGDVALAERPTRFRLSDRVTEAMVLSARDRRIAIRHTTGDGLHPLLVDPVPPGRYDPAGLHAAVPVACHVEPTDVDRPPTPAPLLLTPELDRLVQNRVSSGRCRTAIAGSNGRSAVATPHS